MESKPTGTYFVEDPFSRTSVTVDEAVAIMLGYADGPIVASSLNANPSDDELECLRGAVFDINDCVTGRRDSLETEYLTAKEDTLREAIINKAREALDQSEREVIEAKRWLCEIEDELNKGEASALRLDIELSNDHFRYITLTSLKQWADNKGYKISLFLASCVGVRTPKMLAQDKAILDALQELKVDPLNIPKSPSGMPGVRSKVGKLVAPLSCFGSPTAFKHAWDRLINENKAARK